MKALDVDGAFEVFPGALFDEVEMCSMGAWIDTEILARSTYLGYRIGQLGVSHYPRMAGEQTGANLSVTLRAFQGLFKLHRPIRHGGAAACRRPIAEVKNVAVCPVPVAP